MNRTDLIRYGLTGMIFLLIAAWIMPPGGYYYDVFLWQKWANYVQDASIENAYHSGTDYLPIFQYILYFFGKIVSLKGSTIEYLKLVTYAFQLVTGYFLLDLCLRNGMNRMKAWLLSWLYLLSPAVLYNTFIWAQVDAIQMTFIFGSFYFAYRKKALFSLIFLLLGLNFKLQSLVFIPLILLMLLPDVKNWKWHKVGLGVVILALIQVGIVLPFALNGDFELVWRTFSEAVGRYPRVSMNAFNLWELIYPDPINMEDDILFRGMTLRKWGMAVFFVLGGMALFPLLIINMGKSKDDPGLSLKVAMTAGALIPILFFFVNTQMHERYSHPMLVFLAGLAILYGRYLPLIVGSVAYLLNLEVVLNFFRLHEYWDKWPIFNRQFIAVLFLLLIIRLFYDLYNEPGVKKALSTKSTAGPRHTADMNL